MFDVPHIDDRISVGQLIQIGQITVLALAFLFRRYFGAENTAEQTKQHAGLLAQQAETVSRLTNLQNLQQVLLEKIEHRLQLIEKDFYVPVVNQPRDPRIRERREDREGDQRSIR
jgi:hypothetical protein